MPLPLSFAESSVLFVGVLAVVHLKVATFSIICHSREGILAVRFDGVRRVKGEDRYEYLG
tara:strand:- start:58 stop:237 length:180 start_codon:yes stop_codon:yes gene_type:complete